MTGRLLARLVPRGLSQIGRRRYQRWLDRRIPPAGHVRLNQGNLFIFISRQGGFFLLTATLVWIGATNYQNNLVLGLCFLLLAVLFVAIHQTFLNLSGLELRFVSAEPVFAGQTARCVIELISGVEREQLHLGFPDQADVLTSLTGHQAGVAELPFATHQRGWCHPGRFRLYSDYPLGLVRCWTWLDLRPAVLVYPRPLASLAPTTPTQAGADRGQPVAGVDDFLGLRPYTRGDPLSRVSWKHQAAGHGLWTREQVDYRSEDLWLDYASLPNADPEMRLSRLCGMALQLAGENRAFGLRLPDCRLEVGAGDAHLRQVLRALAECSV